MHVLEVCLISMLQVFLYLHQLHASLDPPLGQKSLMPDVTMSSNFIVVPSRVLESLVCNINIPQVVDL